MIVLVASLAAVLSFIGLLLWMEKRSRETYGTQGRRVESLPGAPMRSAPGDWVVLRRGLGVGEAQVVRGLLESNGIRVAADASGPQLAQHLGMPPGPGTTFTVSVAPGDADVARDLLGD